MTSRSDLIHYLRDHIVGALHVGQMRSGDRLPSIREVAKQFGRNERTVKAAYAALEQDGLVEVRGRSGVFIATQEVPGYDVVEETSRWLSGVVAEAWRRRIGVRALPQFIERLTSARRVRCALVEVAEDAIVAFRHELENEFGFDVQVVAPNDLGSARNAEFFIATSFLAPSIHAQVAALGKPLIVITVHPALKEAVNARFRAGQLTVVAVDPGFAERMRVIYSPDEPERVRFVPANDERALAQLDPDEPVLLTRAADVKIGASAVPLIYPHSPTLSPETAHALATMLVRRHLEQ